MIPKETFEKLMNAVIPLVESDIGMGNEILDLPYPEERHKCTVDEYNAYLEESGKIYAKRKDLLEKKRALKGKILRICIELSKILPEKVWIDHGDGHIVWYTGHSVKFQCTNGIMEYYLEE